MLIYENKLLDIIYELTLTGTYLSDWMLTDGTTSISQPFKIKDQKAKM